MGKGKRLKLDMAVMDAMGGQNTGKKAVVLLEHVQAARAAMAAA